MDLIENKLSCMTVNDRDDLREKVTLQRALYELSSATGMSVENFADDQMANGIHIPRRGRRRRISEGSYA